MTYEQIKLLKEAVELYYQMLLITDSDNIYRQNEFYNMRETLSNIIGFDVT